MDSEDDESRTRNRRGLYSTMSRATPGHQTYPPPPSTVYPPPPQQSHRAQLDRQGSGYIYGLVPGGNPSSAYGAYGGYLILRVLE